MCQQVLAGVTLRYDWDQADGEGNITYTLCMKQLNKDL